MKSQQNYAFDDAQGQRYNIPVPELELDPHLASEIPVEIRSADSMSLCSLGDVALATDLETQTSPIICKDTSACCEDCPDVNDNPPSVSECPFFEFEAGKWPMCTRPGNSDQELNQFFLNQ